MSYVISAGKEKGTVDLRINGYTITMDYISASKLGEQLQRTAFNNMSQEVDKIIIPPKLKFLLDIGAIDKLMFYDISDSIEIPYSDYALYKITAYTKESKEKLYGARRDFCQEIKFSKSDRIFKEQLKEFGEVQIIFASGPLLSIGAAQ